MIFLAGAKQAPEQRKMEAAFLLGLKAEVSTLKN